MYKTGGVIKNIPLAGPIIAAPLEYPQEQENKRIAEENRALLQKIPNSTRVDILRNI